MFVSFPSIENFSSIYKELNVKKISLEKLDNVEFIGRIKLHGTNAGVIIDKDSINFQSRNKIITPLLDNAGFASFAIMKNNLWRNFYNLIVDESNPMIENPTIIIYGEWCGKNIQKRVAISELERMFVIFGIYNVQEEKFISTNSNLTSSNDRIFDIREFPYFTINLNMYEKEACRKVLDEITLKVEDECPVGKYFGVSGVGEGLVWSSNNLQVDGIKRFIRFKTKGLKHAVSQREAKVKSTNDKCEKNLELLDLIVPEWRLKQMCNELEKPISTTDVKAFIDLVCADVLKEELATLEEHSVEFKNVKNGICKKSQMWLIANMDYINSDML
jgi:hypothetical protein